MDRPTRRASSVPGGTAGSGEARRRRGGPRRTSGEKRQRILDAALRCFVGVGYEHTRIGDICAESGFSVGSVYHFFGSKAEVAADLCADGIRRWAEAVGREILTAPSAEAAVRNYVLAYFDWVRANPDLYNFMNDHRPTTAASSVMPEIEAAHASVDTAMRTRFEAEANAGRIRRMPSHVYRAAVDGPCYSFLLWWSRTRGEIGDLPEVLADATWQALAPGPLAEAETTSAQPREVERARGFEPEADAVRVPGGAMRRRILMAALAVFGELGYEQATVGDIAERSGASIGTIYYHFASKEEIAAHWCREGWRDWAHCQIVALKLGGHARTMVRNLVLANFGWVEANPDLYAFLYDARRVATGPLAAEAYQAMRETLVPMVTETMSDAAARGEVRRMNPRAYPTLIVGMCQGYLVPWTARRDALGEVPEVVADTVWRALRALPADAERPGQGRLSGSGTRAPPRMALAGRSLSDA